MGVGEGENGELLINGHKISVKQDEYVLEISYTTTVLRINNNVLYT